MRMKRRWFLAAGLAAIVGAVGLAYRLDLLPLPEVEDGDYPLESVSVFVEDGRSNITDLTRGSWAWWERAPDEYVLWVDKETNWKTIAHKGITYPALKSGRPLYGAIDFAKGKVEPGKGTPYYFVVDESQGTGKGYDRLHFDLNRDGNLPNDGGMEPMESPSAPSHLYNTRGKSVVFPILQIPFDFGPHYGTRSVEVLPRLSLDNEHPQMFFVAGEARKGKIQMGHWRFSVVLAQTHLIPGRYDLPGSQIYLMANWRGPLWQRWWGDEDPRSFRPVGERLYQLTATPTGDTLQVRRYRGELGLLRIEPGRRKIDEMAMRGSLASSTAVVPIGKLRHPYSQLERVRESEVPVGDYSPMKMAFRYGRLEFWLSDNYHSDGKNHGASWPPGRTIRIRKERPFVLDFSNRPEVMFVSPAKGQIFQAGSEAQVKAVLIDPVLNTMIRGLNDTSRKRSRQVGNRSIQENMPLEPKVTISDSSGKKLAEGTMPFG